MTSAHRGAGRVAGMAAALFAVCVWAGWLPMTRLAVVSSLSPLDLAVLRYGVAGLVLAPVLIRRRREIPWAHPTSLIAILWGAGVPYFLLFAYGLRLANSGQGGVLGPGAVSVLVALLAWWLLGERPGTARLVGIAVTGVGVAIVVGHDLATGGGRLTGFALILLASLSWAAFTIASRRLALSPLLVAAISAVPSALLLVPIYFLVVGWQHFGLVPAHELLLQAGYQGLLTAVGAMMAFAFAVERLGAAGASSVTPLSPVLMALFGWLILRDTVDLATGVGLGAVALGVVIANRPFAVATTSNR